ncbi:MAG: SIMPL domain-containing protein [Flavobacteriales bacterium]|nr:SIMPL domain-containing protein [Flavobacteriales bacterium]
MKILSLFTALLTVLTITTFAQDAPQPDIYKQAHVEVTGTAERYVVPDEIVIEVIIKERKDGKDEYSIEYQEGELRKAIAERLPNIDFLEINDQQARSERIRITKKGVRQDAVYTIEVKNAEEASILFSIVEDLNLHSAELKSYDYSKREEVLDELHLEAAVDAKESAQGYCDVLGVKLGKAIIIKESNRIPPRLPEFSGVVQVASYYPGEQSSTKAKTSIKKIRLSASVEARFLLE